MARPRQQKYSKGDFFADGVHLAELTNVSIKHASGASDVNTIAKGAAGENPGVERSMVTFGSAIPLVGREYDFLGAMQKGKLVEIVVYSGGKKRVGQGFVREVSEDYDVNSPSKDSITISCGPFEESTI